MSHSDDYKYFFSSQMKHARSVPMALPHYSHHETRITPPAMLPKRSLSNLALGYGKRLIVDLVRNVLQNKICRQEFAPDYTPKTGR